MTPAVSVMMPAYNAGRYVAEAAGSILAQTFADFELLVVDDGSTDETPAILRRVAEGDARVRLAGRPNRGIVATRNELLGMARGEFVAVMDADDVALPGRLALQVDHLRRHPDCPAVGGDVEVIDPDGAPLCVWKMRRGHDEIDAALLEPGGMVICHSAATMRRADVEAVGGYRPGTDSAEDTALWLDLAARGRLANLPEVVVKYRVHATSVSHAGLARQSELARAAIDEARGRRGMAPLRALGPPGAARPASPADDYRRWAWWALGEGRAATARKHARAGLARDPLSVDSWKLLLCALRGR